MTYEGGRMTVRETVSALPEGTACDNGCADLHLTPDGRFLYASNRGHDTIATFRVGPDGALSSAGWVPCGGKTPRSFAIDPSGWYVLVGNQDSDSIEIFTVSENGSLLPCARADFPTPVCLKFFTGIIGN